MRQESGQEMSRKKVTPVATIFAALGVIFVLTGTFVCFAITDLFKKISGEEKQ
jgi:hypothetical protein